MEFDGKKITRMIESTARNALFDVSEGVLTEMVNAAPIQWGTLRRQHDLIKDRRNSKAVFVANTPYAEAVHDGAKPHIIRPSQAKALWWAGLMHPVGVVNHPGNKANPWMQRTMDASSDRIDNYILDRIEAALERGFGGT